MKIALITTLPSLIENKRIEEESKALGHSFELVNLKEFVFKIRDSKLSVGELSDVNADIYIVRGIFNSLKPITSILKKMREGGAKIFDNNLLNHKYSINKVADLAKLALAGIPTPDTYHVRDWDDYKSAGEKLGYPFVVKSTRAGKGMGIYKIEDEMGLKELIVLLQNDDKKPKNFILQEFFDYDVDLRALVIGDDVFTMQRIPAEGEFRANFSLGGSVKQYDLSDEDKKLAIDALNAVSMSVGGVDILIGKDGRRVILEVNHTAGMVGMEKATGENITRLYVEHALANAF